jgi:CRISPR-associated endonuclease/helicase Cas3
MIVIVSSECSGAARDATQRVLDDFLPRIGRRTWSGRITEQGLLRARKALAAVATKSTSVCCLRSVGTKRLTVQWFVGNRRKFDTRGNCSVQETERTIFHAERQSSAFERLCVAAVVLGGLLHDLGKFTEWFQRKLRGSAILSDAVRHELVSCAIIEAMFHGRSEQEVLVELSDPARAASMIEVAYARAFETPERYLFKKDSGDRFSKLAESLVADPSREFERLHLSLGPETPKLAILLSLVISHHRLPGAKVLKNGRLAPTCQNLVHRDVEFDMGDKAKSASRTAALRGELDLIFTQPRGLVPLWQDQNWIDKVAAAARELLNAEPGDFHRDMRAASLYGRTAVILGDHRASQKGSELYPMEGSPSDPDLAYANTNREKGTLAEPLSPHLVAVGNDAGVAARILFAARRSFPGLNHEELPSIIVSPDASVKNKFRWQAEAGKAVRRARRSLPSGAGFFGVMNAGTGAGKTRAAPIIMAAAAMPGEEMRLNMCTGLRSLTLQAGDEYLRDMNFQPEDVSVVIGDRITAELHAASADRGTEAAAHDLHSVVQLDRGISTRPLPFEMNGFVADDFADPNTSLLSAPVLVSTIDTLMGAADARRGGHVLKTLRVATADLVIDEIDNFGDEDIVAIARLVHVAGTFGRNVLISSATLSPEIARHLFAAYQSGWELHLHATGLDAPIVTGWFSNLAEARCIRTDSAEDFQNVQNAFCESVVAAMAKVVPKRRARVGFMSSVASPAEYFDYVSKEVETEHAHNHVIDPATGKRVSIGVVRWVNVAPSMMYAKHLLEHGLSESKDVYVIPYNGTLLPAVRHELEAVINPLLRRKHVRGADPILSNVHVRRVLDLPSAADDIVIVMVTTSLEEVGRDHDFDWCVLEPGSVRGLIQMAGRILRHRDMAPAGTNVCILQRCFRDVRTDFDRSVGSAAGPVFAYPGVETPFAKPASGLRKGKKVVALESHDAAVVYDMESLSSAVDAREVVGVDFPTSILGSAERRRTDDFLAVEGAENAWASISEFLRDPLSLTVDHHPRHRRFRRSSGKDFEYFISTDRKDGGWFRRPSTGKERTASKCAALIAEIQVNTRRLFMLIDPPEVVMDRVVDGTWGDADVARWKRESLLTVVRPLYKDTDASTTRYHFHPALGFVPIKEWTRGYL